MFQNKHDVLPDETHDEFAREEFCGTMRRFFTETLWPGNNDIYQGRQLPAFEQRHGRAPRDRQEVQGLMEETFYYRASNLFGRCAQEILWDTVGETIERQLPALIAKSKPKPGDKGTLTLDPDLEIPKYIDAVDIHVMPGNFHTELCDDDVFQGALYDRGVFYFGYGSQGADGDRLGQAMVSYVKTHYPDFNPRRILDLGCGVGFSTLPWKDAFPEAEVHGIDVGAPMLRYAHARAESLGREIHFSQQNGASTNFPDGSFDLVCLCIVTHEAPVSVNKAFFKEANRLLAPGGLLLFDGGPRPALPPERDLLASWFTHNVNEPFAAGLRTLVYPDCLVEAGFRAENTFESGRMPAVYLAGMSRTQDNKQGLGFAYAGAFKD
jgi:SAM-dependent methyltransferase